MHVTNGSVRTRSMYASTTCGIINILRPKQNGRHLADDTFKRIFVNKNVIISIRIWVNFVPKCPINNLRALVQIMNWRRPGDNPLSEPKMDGLPTHICVTQPQWVHLASKLIRTVLSCYHYDDGIMNTIASQITSLTIVYSTVYSDADQRKYQSSASLAFVWGFPGELPAQMPCNAENVSIWWRHHDNTAVYLQNTHNRQCIAPPCLWVQTADILIGMYCKYHLIATRNASPTDFNRLLINRRKGSLGQITVLYGPTNYTLYLSEHFRKRKIWFPKFTFEIILVFYRWSNNSLLLNKWPFAICTKDGQNIYTIMSRR